MSGVCFYREQVELCVDILDRILMALSPVSLVQNYRSELQAGLAHPSDIVRILALTQVGRRHEYGTRSHACTFKPLTRRPPSSPLDRQDSGEPRRCHANPQQPGHSAAGSHLLHQGGEDGSGKAGDVRNSEIPCMCF